MRNLLICAALGTMLLAGGCKSDNGEMSSGGSGAAKPGDPQMMSTDACPSCPGVQTATQAGACPGCNAKAKG